MAYTELHSQAVLRMAERLIIGVRGVFVVAASLLKLPVNECLQLRDPMFFVLRGYTYRSKEILP